MGLFCCFMFLTDMIFTRSSANDQHRTRRLADHTFRIAAKQGMGEAGSTVSGKNN